MAFISVAIMLGSYQFMAFMSKAKYSESGLLLDSGSDLNMEGGIAEWVFWIFWMFINSKFACKFINANTVSFKECQRFNYFNIGHTSAVINFELVLVFIAVGTRTCDMDAMGLSDSTVAQSKKRTAWSGWEKAEKAGKKNETRTKV